jgi:SAM-dependent methyltransferase
MTTDAETFWEQHYRGRGEPRAAHGHPVLAEVARSLTPGAALELGCGDGADAAWLAQQGWRVMAVDVSATALERAAGVAEAAGVRGSIAFERHDLNRSLPQGAYDLICALYLQSPAELTRDRALRAAAELLTPGGLLLVVDHGSTRPWGWDPEGGYPTAQELHADIGLDADRFRPERLDAPAREAVGPAGETATVLDTVVVVRPTG